MLRWRHLLLAVGVFVLACSGDGGGPTDNGGNPPPGEPPPTDPTPPPAEPPVDPGPASVMVVEGSVERDEGFVQQTVTLQLRNDGGPGVYKIQVWGLPTSPNGPETFMGETEPVEVEEGYEETLTYDVGTASFAAYVLVFSRDQGSGQYQQSDRFDFPIE